MEVGVDDVSVLVLAGSEFPSVVGVDVDVEFGLLCQWLVKFLSMTLSTYSLEAFFFKPTARPTASAIMSTTTTAPMTANFFQPRRLSLFPALSCPNFSLLGVGWSLHTLTLKLLPLRLWFSVLSLGVSDSLPPVITARKPGFFCS